MLEDRVMSKKKWSTPKLIVLARGKPEEYVLETCKVVGGGGKHSIAVGDCKERVTPPVEGQCDSYVGS